MNPRYVLLEAVRQLRNVRALVFTFVVPIAMLLIFGTAYGAGGAIDPSTHTITEYAFHSGNTAPSQIAAAPDGTLWFTNGFGRVGEIHVLPDDVIGGDVFDDRNAHGAYDKADAGLAGRLTRWDHAPYVVEQCTFAWTLHRRARHVRHPRRRRRSGHCGPTPCGWR